MSLLMTHSYSNAQSIKQDKQGNFYQIKDIINKKLTISKPTGKTYTDTKGNVFPIFVSENGKYYIKRVSKNTGKEYKQYLKI